MRDVDPRHHAVETREQREARHARQEDLIQVLRMLHHAVAYRRPSDERNS